MSSCAKCDELEAGVAQATAAVNYAIKNQAALTYAQVRQLQSNDHPLRRELASWLRKRSNHRSKEHR